MRAGLAAGCSKTDSTGSADTPRQLPVADPFLSQRLPSGQAETQRKCSEERGDARISEDPSARRARPGGGWKRGQAPQLAPERNSSAVATSSALPMISGT